MAAWTTTKDEHGYPADRSSGHYSTVDVCKILGYPMETLQQWLIEGHVRPAYRVKYGRGKRSVFVRSQVLWIGVFKSLVDHGIPRALAVNWANEFFDILKEAKTFEAYDILVVEFAETGVCGVSAFSGEVVVKADSIGNDLLIVNIHRIIEKIKAFSR